MQQRTRHDSPRSKTFLSRITDWFVENKSIVRFCMFFGVFLGVCTLLLETDFSQQHFVTSHLKHIAFLAGTTIQYLGTTCTISGTSIMSPRFSVDVVQGCDSIYPTAMLWAALLAYPSTWKSKLIGMVGGAIVLFVINIIRIVTMFYIGVFVPSLFDMVHVYAWQALFILLTLAVWLFWAAKISRTPTNV
jgi:exosortase H (IPTLxxWG-CTERM-specific)